MHVPSKAVRHRNNAFCSECYLEGKELYFKDISLMSACPIHLRKYITSCPSCGISLHWFSPLYQQCSCGAELTSEKLTTDQVEPEIYLSNIWKRKDQGELDRLISILNTLEYNASAPETNDNREILSAAIHIIKGNTERLTCYARQLLDWYPHVPQELIKSKLSGLPGITKEIIDRLFLLANQLPENNKSTHKHFTLTRKQVMNRFNLSCSRFSCLKQHQDFPRTYKGHRKYTCAEVDKISSLVDLRKSTSREKNLVDTSVFFTADEAASVMEISRYQLTLIIRCRLLEASTGHLGKVLIERGEWTRFTNEFTTTKSLATHLGVPARRIRDRIRECFPEAERTGNQAVDRLLVRTEHATSLIRDGIPPLSLRRGEKARASWARRKHEMQFIEEPDESWTSIRQAASTLGVGNSEIIDWVRNHQLTDVRVGKCGKYLIPSDQILNFWSKYITANEIAKQLKLPIRSLTSILFLDGLTPVTGPLVDSSHTHLYLRTDAYNYLEKTKTSASHPRWLLPAAARLSLGTTLKKFNRIMSTPYFSDAVKRVKNSIFISKDTIEKFKNDYILIDELTQSLELPLSATQKILFDAGVFPVSDPALDGCGITIFRRHGIFETLSRRIENPSNTSQTTLDPIKPQSKMHTESNLTTYIKYPNHTLMNDLINELNITKIAFTDIFIKSGYITPKNHLGKKYLDSEMVAKVRSVLQDHYTCRQADEILGQKSRTRNFILSNALTVVHPIPSHVSRANLVKKEQVHQLADAIGSHRKPT